MDRERFIEVLKDLLNLAETDYMNTPFRISDLDSFDKVNLLNVVEDYYESEISIVDLFECSTINDIISLTNKLEDKVNV